MSRTVLFLNNGETPDVTANALACMALIIEPSFSTDVAVVIIPDGEVLGFVDEQEALDAIAGELKAWIAING